MKYSVGNIVLLKNEKTVYISQADEESKTYLGIDTDDDTQEPISFTDSQVFMLVT